MASRCVDIVTRSAPDRTADQAGRDGLAAGVLVDGWRVTRQLGRGGMSTVHGVVHTQTRRRAALKIAHAWLVGPRLSVPTFLREARIAQTLAHPSVITIHDLGVHEGRPFLIMERLEGSTLRAMVRDPSTTRAQGLEVLLAIAGVLQVAHAAGIVHRDLKLENVFLVAHPRPGQPRLRLIDWGVAHVVGEDDPFRGVIAGTLTYVAPEQIRGAEVTPAADVYSLAVLAYRLLVHAAPFSSESDLELLNMHLRTEPPRLSTAWPDVPPPLEEVLLAMLEKDPCDRPRLAAVIHVLRDALARVECRGRTRARDLHTRPARLRSLTPARRPPLPPPARLRHA